MFMRRDFDLNSVDVYADSSHVYTDSLKEVFRKTMVTQEIIFQNQVHELHRIYGTQRTLMMQNNSWIEFDRCNSNNKVGSGHSKSHEFFEECHGMLYKLQQRPFVGHVGHTDNLKLSPSVGDKNNGKRSGTRTWFDMNLSRDVIDLEDSTETTSNQDDTGLERDLPVDSRSKHESQRSVVTDLVLRDHEGAFFDRDLERCESRDLNEIFSPKKQQRSSCVMLDLDLNKAYCDDSSCQSNDPMITHPSTASSSHASDEGVGRAEGDFQSELQTKECNNVSDETSIAAHQNGVQNHSPSSSKENYETCPLSDESHVSDKVLSPEMDENVASASETSNSETHKCPDSREASPEKGKFEDVVISCSTVGEVHSDTSSSEFDDASAREAAELLVHISVENSSCYRQDCCFEEENNETATPELSSDSFELFTLGLKQCNEDDDMCVSSKPSELDVVAAENKGYSLKIRRGRRLKDFQRDILPGLASLSRHEIREDINILEGVLRSREYRKMQAKMADIDGHGWSAPARSRRSRPGSATKRRRF